VWRVLLAVALMLALLGCAAIADMDDALRDGAARLESLQNDDGGWDWPLDDGNPGSASPLNTVGPIAMGLGQAYWNGETGTAGALADAGGLLLSKTDNFSPSDGYFAVLLDSVFGGSTYRDHVSANYYGPLAAGTYDRNGSGTLYDTAGYVQSIRDARAGQGIPNLAAWDIGMGLVGAAACGGTTAAWIDGTKAEIDELTSAGYYDVIGLAGAVFGLAYVSEDHDPIAGEHAAAGSLGDLAAALAGYQIAPTGGFTWNAAWMGSYSDEAVQETAYAILALNEVDRAGYFSNIVAGADFLISSQFPTGGWEQYPYYHAYGENNELTGEAMWGIRWAYLDEIWVDDTGNDNHFGCGFLPLATVQCAVGLVEGTGGTVHVGHGDYVEAVTVRGSVEIVSEVGSAAHTSLSGPIEINAPNVLLGRIRQGFTVTGPITIGAGVDATTIHINWNDIYDVLTNNGDGLLDATFNFWGTDGPDTVGLVNVNPILPETSDTVIGYMDDHGLDAADAITFSHYVVGGFSVGEALLALEFSGAFGGFSMEELEELIDEYGSGAVRRALTMSGGDWEEFLALLIGFGVGGGGGGALLGDLAGRTVGATGLPTYVAGQLLPLTLELFHPVTGEPITDATVSYTVTRTLPDGTSEVVAFGVLPYHEGVGSYAFSYDTTGLGPGVYDIYIGTPDGNCQHFQVEVTG